MKVVGVRFKEVGKIYYFTYGELELSVGDKVIVETVKGLEFGEVVVGPKEVKEENWRVGPQRIEKLTKKTLNV